MKGFTLKVDDQGLSVKNMEKYFEIMKLHFLRIVINIDVHLLSGKKASFTRFNLEDAFLQYMPLESLLLSRLARISPGFQLNFIVIRHFKLPFRRDTSNIL